MSLPEPESAPDHIDLFHEWLVGFRFKREGVPAGLIGDDEGWLHVAIGTFDAKSFAEHFEAWWSEAVATYERAVAEEMLSDRFNPPGDVLPE